MPGHLNVIRDLRQELPGVVVIVLTYSNDVTLKAQALASGAAGYPQKSIDPDELIYALRMATGGTGLLTAQDLRCIHRSAIRDVFRSCVLS